MPKRLLALSLLLLLLLSACATQNSSKDDAPITLSLWHYYNDATKSSFDALVQDYNETLGKKRGVLIDAYAYSGVNDLADAVFASATGELGSPPLPNIFAAYADNAYRLNELSVVASLAPYFSKDELALYRADFLQEGVFPDAEDLRIIPVAKSTEAFYLNRTDFEPFAQEMNISLETLSTWEGLAQVAALYDQWTDAKTPEPNDGAAFFGIDSFANFFLSAGKQLDNPLFTHEGEHCSFSMSQETAQMIWDYLYTPYLKGHYDSIGRFRSDDTKSGDLIAYVGSTASAKYFPTQVEADKDSAYPIEVLVLPYPHFANAAPVAVQQGAGLVVAKSDKRHESAAADFLKWLTAPEQNLQFALSTGYMPVQNEALKSDQLSNDSLQRSDNPNDAISQTTRVVYDMLEEYTLYANKPFASSYDARNVLDRSLKDFLTSERLRLSEGLAQGADRASLIGELTSSPHFERWYSAFVEEMTALVK